MVTKDCCGLGLVSRTKELERGFSGLVSGLGYYLD